MSQTRMLQPSQGQVADNRPSETQITINVNGVPVTPLQRVFLQRDYRLGVAIRFMTDFPIELSERIDPKAFDYTLKEINEIFEEAEQFTCTAFCESCLGFITANLYWFCRDSRYEKALKRISKFIAEQNQCVYLPNSLYLTDPVVRGLRCIEISVIGNGGDQLPRS